jgi:hypothetical protein
MTLDEKVAIFLYIVRFGATQTVAESVFKRGKGTISRTFNEVLSALLPLYEEEVSHPTEQTPVSSVIRRDSKF